MKDEISVYDKFIQQIKFDGQYEVSPHGRSIIHLFLTTLSSVLYRIPTVTLRVRYVSASSEMYALVIVEKAFLMVSVRETHYISRAIDLIAQFIIVCFTRVIFGVSASTFLLNATAIYFRDLARCISV